MEKIFIKSLDKEINIDPWREANLVAAEVLANFIIETKLGEKIINSEVTNDGFFVDFVVLKNVSEKSLPLIQGKIKKQLSKNVEVSSELPTSMIKGFELRGVSGLKLENKQANRIFGFATLSLEQFDKKKLELKEREERDHRKIGKELELFMLDDLAGKGMPIWLENGVLLKRQIKQYIWNQEKKYGSEQIETPILGSADLYKTSGHYAHYRSNMFPEMTVEENETFILRPMSCPHHIIVYKSKPRSYKELPVRYAENVKQYRYEHSGALLGLERVRAMELTDSHIFLREDQLKEEIEKAFNLIQETLNKFDIEIDYIELALHDIENKEKYHGDHDIWVKSEKILKDFLDTQNIKYKAMQGEAAFYGPKIDVQIKTALGHQITVSTIQLDFLLPERFQLTYKDANQNQIQPIMMHRGLIGTYERFISVLLEQTKGNLPMWLAPQQAIVVPINNELHTEYALKVLNLLDEADVRAKIDLSDERLSNKVRTYQKAKVKTIIMVGDEEIKNQSVSYRYYGSEDTHTISLDKLKDIYM